MTRLDRLRRKYAAEYNYGGYIARRVHVAESNTGVIIACAKALGSNPYNWTRSMRDARHALYRGAIAAHLKHRQLVQHFRL